MDYCGHWQTQRLLHEVAVPALDEAREDPCARGLKGALETGTVGAFGIDTAGLRLEPMVNAPSSIRFTLPRGTPLTGAGGGKHQRMEFFSLEGSHGYNLMASARTKP